MRDQPLPALFTPSSAATSYMSGIVLFCVAWLEPRIKNPWYDSGSFQVQKPCVISWQPQTCRVYSRIILSSRPEDAHQTVCRQTRSQLFIVSCLAVKFRGSPRARRDGTAVRFPDHIQLEIKLYGASIFPASARKNTALSSQRTSYLGHWQLQEPNSQVPGSVSLSLSLSLSVCVCVYVWTIITIIVANIFTPIISTPI